jgi:putative NADPH-quinone reductase
LRVLYLYCHPLPDSFHAAIRKSALAVLEQKGHAVDLLDLYAESFQPVLTVDERRDYFDSSRNQAGLEGYIERLRNTEALVVQFPTWNFGAPAMLKGFFDRLLIPGVAIDMTHRRAAPMLGNIGRIVGIVTYGQPWLAAFWIGDPPRKTVTRFLPWFAGGKTRAHFCALYDVDNSTDDARRAYIARVRRAMRRL